MTQKVSSSKMQKHTKSHPVSLAVKQENSRTIILIHHFKPAIKITNCQPWIGSRTVATTATQPASQCGTRSLDSQKESSSQAPQLRKLDHPV